MEAYFLVYTHPGLHPCGYRGTGESWTNKVSLNSFRHCSSALHSSAYGHVVMSFSDPQAGPFYSILLDELHLVCYL